MKLQERSVEGFLDAPGPTSLVLLHGDDAGLVRERGRRLAVAVAGSANDAFRVATVDRESIGTLKVEMTARSLSGGRRVVRVRDAGDAVLNAVADALPGSGDTLTILECGALPARSRLRAFAESSAACVAILCHGGAIRAQAAVARAFEAAGVTGDSGAIEWLVAHLPGDSAAIDRELEKLVTYVGATGVIDAEDARACLADGADQSSDEAVFAAGMGQPGPCDRAVQSAYADGMSAVTLLRALVTHFQRLHAARAAVDAGSAARDAAASLRPPVFARSLPAFVASVSAWSLRDLEAVLEPLLDAERECKRTGAPAVIRTHREFLKIATRIRRRRSA